MSALWDIVVVALERLLRSPKQASGAEEEVQALESEIEIELKGEEGQKEEAG